MSNPLLIFTVVTEFVCVCEKTTNEKKKISCKYTNQNLQMLFSNTVRYCIPFLYFKKLHKKRTEKLFNL